MKKKKKSADPAKAMLRDIEVESFLKEAIDVDPEFLSEEFVRIPADLAYYNERYSRALGAYLEAKAERERIAGELSISPKFIKDLTDKINEYNEEDEKPKRPTVDQLKAAVLNDPAFIEARLIETRADAERTRLRGCVDALATKRDMVVSLGAHVRLEMQHDPVVRSRMAAMRELGRDPLAGSDREEAPEKLSDDEDD